MKLDDWIEKLTEMRYVEGNIDIQLGFSHDDVSNTETEIIGLIAKQCSKTGEKKAVLYTTPYQAVPYYKNDRITHYG